MRIKGNWKIFTLYFILSAGALWHQLGWFQPAMRLLAGPMIMAIAGLIFFEILRIIPNQRQWIMISACITLFGWAIEWLGVRTGFIFGIYTYGHVLQPQIASVPVAMGCAWFSTLIGSLAWARHLKFKNVWAISFVTAVFMLLLDLAMEPAAIRLNYWQWRNGHPPLQNYLAWWITGASLCFLTLPMLRGIQLPDLARHAWLAQALYFGIILL